MRALCSQFTGAPGDGLSTETDMLDPSAIAHYRENGFASIDKLISRDMVEHLRGAYAEVLASTQGTDKMNLMGGAVPQILQPSLVHEVFADNEARTIAAKVAADLMGVEAAAVSHDMLIYKAPGNTVATPWHQDQGYGVWVDPTLSRQPGLLDYVQLWLALDDADQDNGCMHFIPKKHLDPTLDHEMAPEGRMLRIVDVERYFDITRAVACPIPAGGATMHGPNTPHFTSGNRSDRPRRAYIMTFVPG